jgi:hypothetical protein
MLCLALLVGLTIASISSQPSRVVLLMLVVTYLLADFSISFAVGLSGGLRCAGWMLLVFPALHVSYGVGYLRGMFDFWIRRKQNSLTMKPIPLSR